MNNHSKRLLDSVFQALDRYENGIVDADDLLRDVEGISNAIEEEGIRTLVSNLAIKIDESRFLFDVEDGNNFLYSEIKKFKQSISILE